MRILFIVILLSVSFFTFAQKNSYDVVINNVSFIDVNTGKLYPVNNVYIKNGVAEITNKMMKIPTPKKQIDGTGKFFMSALYDMHVHWPDTLATEYFNLVSTAGIGNVRIMSSKPEAIKFARANKAINFSIGFPIRDNSFKFFFVIYESIVFAI